MTNAVLDVPSGSGVVSNGKSGKAATATGRAPKATSVGKSKSSVKKGRVSGWARASRQYSTSRKLSASPAREAKYPPCRFTILVLRQDERHRGEPTTVHCSLPRRRPALGPELPGHAAPSRRRWP